MPLHKPYILWTPTHTNSLDDLPQTVLHARSFVIAPDLDTPGAPWILTLESPSVLQTHISKSTYCHIHPVSYEVGMCGIWLTRQATPGTREPCSDYCCTSGPILCFHDMSRSTLPYYSLIQAIILCHLACSYDHPSLIAFMQPPSPVLTETTQNIQVASPVPSNTLSNPLSTQSSSFVKLSLIQPSSQA